MANVSAFRDSSLSENTCIINLNQLSSLIQQWTESVNDLVLACKQVSDAHRDLSCLSSIQHLPPDLDRDLWLNSLKLKLGSSVERSFDLMSRLRSITLDVFEAIEVLERELCSIARTRKAQNNWTQLSWCTSLIGQFRSALANECDAIGLYHMRTVFANDEVHIPSTPLVFEPDLPVISKLWSESYLPAFRILVP
ncbi:unnamed protein product [Echinostoma caproni]|uniref:DHC_N1 domain-containing protein n=1 Tax=Echinostoma caproni TaxID=27848 RepID=A0A183AF10_9TREM|nr:unnamed protein product [Echinostoma caproni]